MTWSTIEKITAAGIACTLLGGMYYLGSEVSKSSCASAMHENDELKKFNGNLSLAGLLQNMNVIAKDLAVKFEGVKTQEQQQQQIEGLNAKLAASQNEMQTKGIEIANLNKSIDIAKALTQTYTVLRTFSLHEGQYE